MPRNPENRRVEILLSPEQYDVLRRYTFYEYVGEIELDPTSADMSQAIRDILSSAIPGFSEARPLVARGKYKRNADDTQ
jgi:hypothetical protein